jgi:hypothetical protein
MHPTRAIHSKSIIKFADRSRPVHSFADGTHNMIGPYLATHTHIFKCGQREFVDLTITADRSHLGTQSDDSVAATVIAVHSVTVRFESDNSITTRTTDEWW